MMIIKAWLIPPPIIYQEEKKPWNFERAAEASGFKLFITGETMSTLSKNDLPIIGC